MQGLKMWRSTKFTQPNGSSAPILRLPLIYQLIPLLFSFPQTIMRMGELTRLKYFYVLERKWTSLFERFDSSSSLPVERKRWLRCGRVSLFRIIESVCCRRRRSNRGSRRQFWSEWELEPRGRRRTSRLGDGSCSCSHNNSECSHRFPVRSTQEKQTLFWLLICSLLHHLLPFLNCHLFAALFMFFSYPLP